MQKKTVQGHPGCYEPLMAMKNSGKQKHPVMSHRIHVWYIYLDLA